MKTLIDCFELDSRRRDFNGAPRVAAHSSAAYFDGVDGASDGTGESEAANRHSARRWRRTRLWGTEEYV
jgi:hypothetical protein